PEPQSAPEPERYAPEPVQEHRYAPEPERYAPEPAQEHRYVPDEPEQQPLAPAPAAQERYAPEPEHHFTSEPEQQYTPAAQERFTPEPEHHFTPEPEQQYTPTAQEHHFEVSQEPRFRPGDTAPVNGGPSADRLRESRREEPQPEPQSAPFSERLDEPAPDSAPTMLAAPVPPPLPQREPSGTGGGTPSPTPSPLPRREPARTTAAGTSQNGSGQQQWPIQPLPGEPPLTLFRSKEMRELPPGSELDRFGGPNGNLTYAAGTAFEERSLVPEWISRPYHVYRVQRPLEALAGVAIPWFNQPGGGAAYLLPASVEELLAEGHLVELEAGEPPIA
ncbi:TNT domain-containing protein, partial [Amycolatopsis rhizosphaerae]|uniref:TNT domain-containing protein n=1 Tax=Amycolatopsis rhizosphaerae TaxID=2053003 RepID=UPI001FED1DB1